MECPNCGNLNAPTDKPCVCGYVPVESRLGEAEAFISAYLAEDEGPCSCELCGQARAYREKWMHVRTREEVLGIDTGNLRQG